MLKTRNVGDIIRSHADDCKYRIMRQSYGMLHCRLARDGWMQIDRHIVHIHDQHADLVYPARTMIGSGLFTGASWMLETVDRNVAATLEYVNVATRRMCKREDIRGLFVQLDQSGADIAAIYAYRGSVPWNYKDAYRIYPDPIAI